MSCLLANRGKYEFTGSHVQSGIIESREGRQLGITGLSFKPNHVAIIPLFTIDFTQDAYNMWCVYDVGYKGKWVVDEEWDLETMQDDGIITYMNGSVLISSTCNWKAGQYYFVAWE